MADKVSVVRLFGLIGSVTAVLALSATVIADNRDAGFREVSHAGQLTLLAVSVMLCFIQIALYVINRRNKNR